MENSDSLFNPKSRGGVIGGKGYNFQDSYIITQIPHWLKMPNFHSFIKEGIDDVDIVFKENNITIAWHYQLKNHQVNKKEFKEVVQNFWKISQRPGIKSEHYIIACCGLTEDISSLWNKVKEYRELIKIFDDSKLESTKADIVTGIKKLEILEYTDFIIEKLTVDEFNYKLSEDNIDHLRELFRGRIIELPLCKQER